MKQERYILRVILHHKAILLFFGKMPKLLVACKMAYLEIIATWKVLFRIQHLF